MITNQESIRLRTSQALDLVLKLLRGVDQVDMSIDENLEITLRPAIDRDNPSKSRAIDNPTSGVADALTQDNAGLAIDENTGAVLIDGQTIPPLTRLEFELLAFLYSRAGAIVKRQEITQTLWPGEPEAERIASLEKLIGRLRIKIEDNLEQPKHLITVRGRGYRLMITPARDGQ